MENYKIKYLNKLPSQISFKGLPGLGWFQMEFWSKIIKFLVVGATTEQVKKLGLFGYPSIISIATIITGSFFLFDRNLETSDTLNLLYSCSTIFVLFLMTCIIWYFATLLRKIKLPKLPLRAPNELDESKNGQEYTPLVTDV